VDGECQAGAGPVRKLYPAMMSRLDLSGYRVVADAREGLKAVRTLPLTDRCHMAVTRDLSACRRWMIQRWIGDDCP
jgi:hypothetical protein